MQKAKKILKPWHKGSHMRVLSESQPMNTNMTWFKLWFSKKYLCPCALDEISLSIIDIPVNGPTHQPSRILISPPPFVRRDERPAMQDIYGNAYSWPLSVGSLGLLTVGLLGLLLQPTGLLS